VVAKAPPLTPHQLSKLAALFADNAEIFVAHAMKGNRAAALSP